MKLSTGVEWSLHCCVVLSQADRPVPAARLAELHGVSKTYLAKHLQSLARANLIVPAEGRDGGYALTRGPGAITVLDVVQAVDGTQPAFRCTEIRQQGILAAPPEQCVSACGIAKVMAAAEQAWRASLSGVTIADLAATLDINQLKNILAAS
ncbi:Rrf2 family transcriptional regulator [Gordonia sp. SID5947]|uniref:RrF2 family transcriptional regulator n=1 Tax=Gordonia sp. SID5947 TaxID=2690315 RepID=UPI00136A42BB|nr:Rrf2 family transcriptional regulator [Gordonia sp. SID5947]MYR08280.1 Rrf2 family transcriptional regulator [Gordonia sp. SID5947]